jgi:Zn-dependent protease with chaperone function
MDRAARNFLGLAAIVLTLAAYGLCGLVAYGIVPLLEGRGSEGPIGVLAVLGLGVLLAISITRACRTLGRQAAATRELSSRIDRAALAPPTRLRLAAGEAGLADRVTLFDSTGSCSFVYGLLAPRVAISSDLLSRLSEAELRAALEHERYHVQSLDPLRSALTDAAVDAMFFLPALRTLGVRYEAARELAADRRAVGIVGPRPLAGALLKTMEGAPVDRPATIPLAAWRSIDSRLVQLETEREPCLAGIDPGALGATAVGACVFVLLLVGTPLTIGGGADLSRELGPASLLEGAVYCLLPLAVASAVISRLLSSRVLRSSLPV